MVSERKNRLCFALQIAQSYKFPPHYPTLIVINKNKIITEIVYAADKGALADVEISINKALAK
jgi:hypothetical protein